jgi:hypothetical protein
MLIACGGLLCGSSVTVATAAAATTATPTTSVRGRRRPRLFVGRLAAAGACPPAGGADRTAATGFAAAAPARPAIRLRPDATRVAGDAGTALSAARPGADRSGADRSGTDRSGTDRSGADRSGGDRRPRLRSGLSTLGATGARGAEGPWTGAVGAATAAWRPWRRPGGAATGRGPDSVRSPRPGSARSSRPGTARSSWPGRASLRRGGSVTVGQPRRGPRPGTAGGGAACGGAASGGAARAARA